MSTVTTRTDCKTMPISTCLLVWNLRINQMFLLLCRLENRCTNRSLFCADLRADRNYYVILRILPSAADLRFCCAGNIDR